MRATRLVSVVLLALVPGVTRALDADALSVSGSARPRLRLVWMDSTSTASFAYPGVAHEVGSILGGIGVDLTWDRRPGGSLERGEIGVVLLDREPARAGMHTRTMGCVLKEEETPVLWVNLKTVGARRACSDP